MITQRILILIFIVFVGVIQGQPEPWTWMYKTVFTDQERAINGTKKNVSFMVTNIPHFTQCIFSWNAMRPRNGYFSLYAQVHDAATKKWQSWHKMFDWGAGIQRSYVTLSDIGTSYHYVRLEIPPTILADAIRIRIESNNGASLSSLYALYASTSCFNKFMPENACQFFNFSSVHIKGIPQLSQKVLSHPRKDGLCSPTSLTMVTNFLTNKKIDPCLFADNAYDAGLDAYGSWPFNSAHAFEQAEGKYHFYVRRLSSFAMLYQLLCTNIPVVVSVRGILLGGAKEYLQGHLMVVVGWDQKNKSVICHDPAFAKNEEVVVNYALKDFLQAWESSRRLVYIAEPCLV